VPNDEWYVVFRDRNGDDRMRPDVTVMVMTGCDLMLHGNNACTCHCYSIGYNSTEVSLE
jgi:hypothetical protein